MRVKVVADVTETRMLQNKLIVQIKRNKFGVHIRASPSSDRGLYVIEKLMCCSILHQGEVFTFPKRYSKKQVILPTSKSL